MSSQFSYELDERQIRLAMQDAELDYNEAMWTKFEAMATPESKSSIAIGNFVSSFNVNISRSVIVPVLFVILISGLSAMLFSFVDFKKKVALDKEIPLIANPDNIIKTVINSVSKSKSVIVEKKSADDLTAKTSPSTSTIAEKPKIVVSKEIKKDEPVKLSVEKSKEEISSVPEIKKETEAKPVRKKKSRKARPIILPTINATTNLNEGSNEPELDLK